MFWMKRPFLLSLKLLKPIYTFWVKYSPRYWAQVRTEMRDPYLSGMTEHFSLFHRWVYHPAFKRTHVDQGDIEHLKDLAREGTLVYVMKKKGQLEYSYFNHLFLKEGIPLARFANKSRTIFWRPLKEMVRQALGKLDLFYTKGLLSDPIQSGYLENLVASGESALLNLKVSRELIFGGDDDSVEFIAPLLEAASKSQKPVFLVTQQYLYDRHPENANKSIVDWLLGEKSNPGTFRKLILFLLSYNKKATVKLGAGLNLNEFLAENSSLDRHQQSLKLKSILLDRLMIERRSITGPALLSRDKMFEKMLRSPLFKSDLEAFSLESGKSIDELSTKATRYFNEIAATINYNYIDLYDRMIHWMVNNIFEGLDLDTEGLANVKAKAGKHPIVLVPSHKSHIDYLLLSYVFYNHDLTMPHVCAGINLNFWPAGRFLRRGGAFFIRRSFDGKKLYKMVLDHYIQTMVREGFTTEFFIEGTRSRTGKLLKPKMGILSMIMDSYLRGATSDMYFVPISMHYEKIMEEKSYVNEIKGGAKEKENVTSLFKIRNKFGRKYGKVYIRFAEPLSIKEFFDGKNIKPHQQSIKDCRDEVEDFAYQLTYHINKVAVVTSTSLVANGLLAHASMGIPDQDVLSRVRLMQRYLEYKGVSFSHVILHQGEEAYHEALHQLQREKAISLHQDFWEKFYTIDEGKHTLLDYHKNNSLHFFVSITCLAKILVTSETLGLNLTEIKKNYGVLKSLLIHDFTFSHRNDIEDHILRVVGYLEQEGIVKYNTENHVLTLVVDRKHPVLQVFAAMLDNFFESSFIALMYLKYVSFENLDIKKLMASILEKGKLFYLKGELKHPEALSQFNIKHALNVFEDLGLIINNGKGLLSRRFDLDTIHEWETLLRSLLGISNTLLLDAKCLEPAENPFSDSAPEIH